MIMGLIVLYCIILHLLFNVFKVVETTTRNMSEFSRQIRDNPGLLIRGRDAEGELEGAG